MKKVLLVVALCVAVLAANAQDNQTAAPKAKTHQVSKVQIKEADLMKPIKDDYVKQVPGATFDKAMKLEKPTKEGGVYNVVVKTKDNVKWRLQYDKDGKFLKKEEMKTKQPKAPATQAK